MRKYEEYKDSGIEWVGEVPSDWRKLKVGRTFKQISSGTTPKSGSDIYYEDGTINWLNTGDLNDDYILKTNRKITQQAVNDFSSLKLFPIGSVVVALYGATIGKLGQLKIEATTNQACCVLSDSDEVSNRFLFYFLLSAREYLLSKAYGGGQPNISQDLIKQMYLCVPSLPEQAAISRYLDHQTGIIDELIAKKEKLIELLKEKRQAVINEAVTKGLDPNAKMKDSGIEWLGEVPEDWEVVKFNHYIYLRHGFQFRDYDFTDDGTKVVKISQLKIDGTLDLSNASFIDRDRELEFQGIIIREGDILMALTGGTIGKIIKAAGVNETLLQNYRVGKFACLDEKLENDFLFWLLSSNVIQDQITFAQRETGQPNIGKEDFAKMCFPLPPLISQYKISDLIGSTTSKIKEMINRNIQVIEKLKEYRQSIISEAVTGKIDVRDWQPSSEPVA